MKNASFYYRKHAGTKAYHAPGANQACSFTVLTGTIFHSARKLPEWFQILALMLNARKSLSSYQIARDLNITQCSAWKIQNKIRKAMEMGESKCLKGIIEMDETCIGGKSRNNIGWNERGRGTSKTPVVGMIERNGEIRTQVIKKDERLNFSTLESIVRKNVGKIKSILITDEYRGDSPMGTRGGIAHAVINHQETYVEGAIHTNTIEGFWSLIKRACYGSHHHYSRENAHLYVAETAV